MIFSDSLYFLLLFTLPAALHIIYHTYIRLTPTVYDDKSVELAGCVVFCLTVFFVNLIRMQNEMRTLAQYLLTDNKSSFCIENNFDYIDFMVKYFKVNLIDSMLVIAIWYGILAKIYHFFYNIIITKILKRPEEYPFSDSWRNLFETNKIVNIGNCIIRIERGGTLITAGLLKMYPAPHVQHKELILYNTDSIRELFEEDTEKDVDHRIFPYAEVEFYDIDNDMLIKFYSAERYDEYYESEEN
jgi:hypothetical protein